MLTVIATAHAVVVISPYHERFIERARRIDGRWNEDHRAWYFRPSAHAAVYNLVQRIYHQIPDRLDIDNNPGGHTTIAHRVIASAIDHETTLAYLALSHDQINGDQSPHGSGVIRYLFDDHSAVIEQEHEIYLGIHEQRLKSAQRKYGTAARWRALIPEEDQWARPPRHSAARSS